MRTGLIYVMFSLLSYSSLGVLHKVAEVQRCRPLPISLLMCAWSLIFLLMAGLSLSGRSLETPASVLILALPFGVCAGVAILALQTALMLGNISTSWLAVNLSAGLPTILSIVLYKEEIHWWKVIALVLMVLSMFLLWKDSQSPTEPELCSDR